MQTLRWVPVGLLGLVVVAHGVGLAQGGVARVIAWHLTVQLVPLFALLFWLPAVGWLAWRRRATAPHAVLLALSSGCVLLAVPGFGLWPITYPLTSLASAHPAATVRLPSDAQMVVFWGGDRISTNYHAMDPTQRWAYDLVVEPAATGSGVLEDYGCYGVPVLAPAAGRVTVATDGGAEQTPGQLVPDYANPAGNHVAIRLETGTHLVIAHLQPGSVAVAAGDDVVEGQVLGRCGNSGNTSEPHIHIHHQRQDPAVSSLIAEALPLYFRDHGGPPMPVGGVEVEGDTVRLVGDHVSHRSSAGGALR
jgi:hypothetical protein